MSDASVYEAIKAHLENPEAITGLSDPATGNLPPIRFENETFFKPDPPAPWISVSLTGVIYGQQSIGAARQADNRWDEEGRLWLPVYVPSGSGSQRVRQLAKRITDIFRGLTLLDGDLEFLDAFIGEGSPSEEEGNWFELPVSIEWRHVEA